MEEHGFTKNEQLSTSTELGFERTVLAYERTLMAWVRTATSMISFGFTIYKFFTEMGKSRNGGHEALLSPRIVGMVMIGFGLITLLLAQVQHHRAIKRIKNQFPDAQRSISSILAVMVLVFGMALFLGALFRQ